MSHKNIITTEGIKIKIDSDIYEKIKDYSWRYTSRGPLANDKKEDERHSSFLLRKFIDDNKFKGSTIAFRNNDVLDWRRSNIIYVREQRNKILSYVKTKKKINNKYDIKYHGITKSKQNGKWVMHFYLNGKEIDCINSDNILWLALLHDMYSVLYFTEPLKLNFDRKIVEKAIEEKGTSMIKTVKWRIGQKVKILLEENNKIKKVDGIIKLVNKDKTYDVMVSTATGEQRIIESVNIFNIQFIEMKRVKSK